VRRAWAAFSRVDHDGLLRELDPEVVVVPFGAVMEGKSYSGHDGVMEWWRNEMLVNWERFHVLPERFELVGERLLVTGRWDARGSESGVDLDIPATWIVEVREGKIVYWQTYTDHAQARRDIGLD
jgi:ketosteroid isomerase-like protein